MLDVVFSPTRKEIAQYRRLGYIVVPIYDKNGVITCKCELRSA